MQVSVQSTHYFTTWYRELVLYPNDVMKDEYVEDDRYNIIIINTDHGSVSLQVEEPTVPQPKLFFHALHTRRPPLCRRFQLIAVFG
jgi:hypothetical protein